MNNNFNYDDSEINIGNFSVKSQDIYVNFDYLYLLSRDNDDTEELIIPADFIPTTKPGDMAVKVQEKVKYAFKF